MEKFIANYRGSICMRTKCGKKASYVILKGEADIPVCNKHIKLAKKELPGVVVSLK